MGRWKEKYFDKRFKFWKKNKKKKGMSENFENISFVGSQIGGHPYKYMILWLIVFLTSLTIISDPPKEPKQPDLGFTKFDAEARREVLSNINFFGGNGEPWYMGFFAHALPGNNMLDVETFNTFKSQYLKILRTPLSTLNDSDIVKNVTYLDICDPFCTFNDVVFGFMDGYATRGLLALFSEPDPIYYPTSKMLGFDVNIGKHFFERTYDSKDEMIGANISALYFTTMVTSIEKRKLLNILEENVLKVVEEFNKNPERKFNLVCIGTARVGMDVKEGLLHVSKFYLTGICLYIVVFLMMFHFFISWKFDFGKKTNYLFGIIILLIPIFSSIIALRIQVLISSEINFLFISSPWITVAYFLATLKSLLLLQYWMYYNSIPTVYTQTVVSDFQLRITVMFGRFTKIFFTSMFCDVTGLCIGALLVPSAYSEFLYFMLLLSLSINFTILFLLTPLLKFFKKGKKTEMIELGYRMASIGNNKNIKNNNINHYSYTNSYNHDEELNLPKNVLRSRQIRKKIIQPYSDFMTTKVAAIISISIMIVLSIIIPYFYLPLVFSPDSNFISLNFRQLVLPDSLTVDGFNIVEHRVWPDSLATVYIIQKPPKNFSDESEFVPFKEMIDDLELVKENAGRNANQMWLFDYMRVTKQNWIETKSLNMSGFKKFITTFPYKDWQTGTRFEFLIDPITNKETPVITKMLFMATHNNVTSIKEKHTLMQKIRNKVSKYREKYDVVPYDTDALNIDIVDQSLQTSIYINVCLVVSLIIGQTFITPKLGLALIGLYIIISSCEYLYILVFLFIEHLTPFSIVSVFLGLLMLSISLSIILYEFYHLNDVHGRRKRINFTITNVMYVILISTISMGCSLLPLIFSKVSLFYEASVIVECTILIILFQGIFILPSLFGFFPKSITME
ncbi:Patched family-containing protein [Strongyloides ratti]|uniref:Patched family-containing protein n=1 Tax=Strongyloides ratti TaxID=34506 RepID=A0A090LML3_STRRB|nr:Patched family-containing protein [Strongyloides ratti]CEF68775.1 Patched family-containing protein [Strongyloides ratti]